MYALYRFDTFSGVSLLLEKMAESVAPGIISFIEKISSNHAAILWLREIELLVHNIHCKECHIMMRLCMKRQLRDGQVFYCPSCKNMRSIRTESLFEVCLRIVFIFSIHVCLPSV